MSKPINRRSTLFAAAAAAGAGLLASGRLAADEPKAADGPQLEGGWLIQPGNKHMPVVAVQRDGEVATISVSVADGGHPQNEAHHISYARIYDTDRIEICSAAFSASQSTPKATFALKVPAGTTLWAVGDCNLHGLWATQFQA